MPFRNTHSKPPGAWLAEDVSRGVPPSEILTQTLCQPSLHISYAKLAEENTQLTHTQNMHTNFNDGSTFHVHSRTRSLPAALGAGRLLKQKAKFEYEEKQFGKSTHKVQKWSHCGFKYTDNPSVSTVVQKPARSDRTFVPFLETKRRACCVH